jgi:hypothetical protein
VQIRETRSIEEGTEIKLWLQGDNIFEAGHLSVERGTSPLPAPHARTDYEKQDRLTSSKKSSTTNATPYLRLTHQSQQKQSRAGSTPASIIPSARRTMCQHLTKNSSARRDSSQWELSAIPQSDSSPTQKS